MSGALYRVREAPDVLDDYIRISEHIETWSGSRAAANVAIEAIRTMVKNLDRFPLRGAQRDDLLPGARAIPLEDRFVIVYTVDEDAKLVSMLGVFYGKEDYAALMRRRAE